MMGKLELFLVIFSVSSVLAGNVPPDTCPNGQSAGPYCSDYQPCKPGYTCINSRCCRDPVCPKGWTEGPSCNTLPGQQRCHFEFICMNGFCCRPPTPPPGPCPPVPLTTPPFCRFWKPGQPQCTPKSCPPGKICCPNQCRWNVCVNPSLKG